MTPGICPFEPLEDCCCLGAPRVLVRSAASMAFNFSAAPEKAPADEPVRTQRGPRQVFSRMDFFPAY